MKIRYIFIALVLIGAAFTGAKYYRVYLLTEENKDEFAKVDLEAESTLPSDEIDKFKIFLYEDRKAKLLYIKKNKEQYFVDFEREGAADIVSLDGNWVPVGEPEQVRRSDGKFIRYYFPIFL